MCAWIAGAVAIGGALLDTATSAHSADEANKTNVKLAREQRAWETGMANTAVQRRANDLEKAGFNRLLAATGPGAATPSVASPTVEPTVRPGWLKDTTANLAMQTEQIRAMRINNLNTAQQAALTAQEARIRKVEADAAERYGTDKADFDYQRSELSVKEAKARIEQITTETARSAAERDRLSRTTDQLVATLNQQVREGQLNLDALERIAKIGGIEGSKLGGVMKTLIDLFKTMKGK